VVGATDVGAQRWAGNRRDSPRGFWRFCRVVPAASSSRAIASRRAGHAPSPSTRPCSAARCQGIPSPFRCPPVLLNLPFSFRCPIRRPFGNNNDGNVVILLALRHPHVGRWGRGQYGTVLSRAWLVLCLAELGEFGKGLAYGREAVLIAEEADHPYSIVSAHVGLGGVQLARGDLNEAVATLGRGLALCWRYDIPVQFRLVASALGYTYALAGRTAEAIPLLEQAANEEGALRMMAGRSLLIIRLAEAYLLAERPDEAATLAARALALARERKERGYEAWGLRLTAAIAASGPRRETALPPYRATVELAAELGMRPLLAIASLECGVLCQQLGTMERGRVEISAAAELFQDMEMRRWRERARAALAGTE